MKDAAVIAACIRERAAYDKVWRFIDPAEFTPMGAHWWPLIREWYGRDPSSQWIDKAQLRERGERVTDPKHWDTQRGWFDDLPKVSPDNVVFDVLEIKRYAKGNELAALIASQGSPDDIKHAIDEYRDLLVTNVLSRSDVRYAMTTDDWFESPERQNLTPMFPKAINDRLDGGLTGGDHVIVFARPEIGKTLFVVNAVGGWLKIKKKVLYVGNEDGIDKIKGRVGLNVSNMTPAEREKFKPQYLERTKKHGLDDRLVAVHLHPGTVHEVEELVREHRPDIVVVDQLRNLSGPGKNTSSRLNQIAIDFRQLLSRYDVVGVSVMQANAGEHGKNKVWHELDDIDESRTGVPAQGDLVIGLGADNNMLTHNTRAASICKNKLTGDHEGVILSIDKARNKVK